MGTAMRMRLRQREVVGLHVKREGERFEGLGQRRDEGKGYFSAMRAWRRERRVKVPRLTARVRGVVVSATRSLGADFEEGEGFGFGGVMAREVKIAERAIVRASESLDGFVDSGEERIEEMRARLSKSISLMLGRSGGSIVEADVAVDVG